MKTACCPIIAFWAERLKFVYPRKRMMYETPPYVCGGRLPWNLVLLFYCQKLPIWKIYKYCLSKLLPEIGRAASYEVVNSNNIKSKESE